MIIYQVNSKIKSNSDEQYKYNSVIIGFSICKELNKMYELDIVCEEDIFIWKKKDDTNILFIINDFLLKNIEKLDRDIGKLLSRVNKNLLNYNMNTVFIKTKPTFDYIISLLESSKHKEWIYCHRILFTKVKFSRKEKANEFIEYVNEIKEEIKEYM